jgi:membrane fusion protein (multidrug efflux system)
MDDKLSLSPHVPTPTPSSVVVDVPLPVRPGANGPWAGAAVKKYKFLLMGGFFLLAGVGMWGIVQLYSHFTEKSKDKNEAKAGPPTVAVNVTEVKLDHFQDVLVAVGTLVGGSEVPLKFEVEGIVDFFDYRDGDKVKKGDIIARMNQRDAYLKMKRAELELDQYENLYAIGGVSRARLEEARVNADLARSALDKTVIRAPWAGILGDKDVEVGEFVTPSKEVAMLVSVQSVLVRLGIIEKQVDKVFPGQKIVVTVDTYPGMEFTGRIENISPIITGEGKTLPVEARLDNDNGFLLPGMFARTKITIFEEENTIAVPNDAVEKTQTGNQVYVVTPEKKADVRTVEVGYISSQFSQIVNGLQPGDLVVTQRPQDLKAGVPVKVIEVAK